MCIYTSLMHHTMLNGQTSSMAHVQISSYDLRCSDEQCGNMQTMLARQFIPAQKETDSALVVDRH